MSERPEMITASCVPGGTTEVYESLSGSASNSARSSGPSAADVIFASSKLGPADPLFFYRGDSEQARTGFNWLPVTGPGTGHRRHHHGQLGLAVWVLVLVYARYFLKTHGAPSRLLQQTSQF